MCCCNAELRTVCTLYFNEIQKLTSMYHVYPRHTSILELKKDSVVIIRWFAQFVVFNSFT